MDTDYKGDHRRHHFPRLSEKSRDRCAQETEYVFECDPQTQSVKQAKLLTTTRHFQVYPLGIVNEISKITAKVQKLVTKTT